MSTGNLPPRTVPLFNPHAERAEIGDCLVAAVTRLIESGSFILGPVVTDVEDRLAVYVNSARKRSIRCIGVASGTEALHMALLALGVGAGDEVVTTSFTWISSAEVIPLVGARVVFADINATTYCVDEATVRSKLTPRTRAVIAVSLFGYMPDYAAIRGAIREAEREFGSSIALIEDGAQSFGATRDGVFSCGSPHTTLAITSFFPSKTLGCYGDGGAVFTTDSALAAIASSLRSHGKDPASGLHTRIGLNGRLDAMQAAILLAKLDHFEKMLDNRVRVATAYNQAFRKDFRIIIPEPPETKGSRHVYGVYTIRVRERDAIVRFLKGRGVACGIYYPVCVHQQPAFRALEKAGEAVQLPVAEMVSSQVLSLPIHAFVRVDEQDYVIATLFEALNAFGVSQAPPIAP
jgi:UDP-2-acetamido-2-deoxy-ribo-hexuluronate aminotransferase